MFIAYIMGLDNELRVKLILKPKIDLFKYGNYEYQIDRKYLYSKKILFIKRVFFSIYLEGQKFPLEFKTSDLSSSISSDTPLDEIGYLLKKLKGMDERILAILIVFNLIVTVLVLIQLNGGFA